LQEEKINQENNASKEKEVPASPKQQKQIKSKTLKQELAPTPRGNKPKQVEMYYAS
jgi:hypothetical protein